MTILNVFKPSAPASNARKQCAVDDETLAYVRPRYEIADEAESFFVEVDLPGVSKQDLGITLHDGLLEVIGKRSH
jgi:HSP20 family molecular chaperone IbpA